MKIYTVEKIALAYIALTGLVLLVFAGTIVHAPQMLAIRALIAAAILLAAHFGNRAEQLRQPAAKYWTMARYFVHLALLGYWYPETFEFNRYLPNLDHLFAHIEQTLFGCQPALLFSQVYASPVFNELMNLGYFSFFPMIAFTGFLFYFTRRAVFDRVMTTIVSAFFVYYLIFIMLPVAGPQYYFPAAKDAETQRIASLLPPSGGGGATLLFGGWGGFSPPASFPAIGTWFNTHETLQENPVEGNGLFRRCVIACQQVEKPTGAFPSSHAGMATIILLLFGRWHRRWLWLLAPVYTLLVLSTVYLKAHYTIDVITGILSALLIWFVLKKLTINR